MGNTLFNFENRLHQLLKPSNYDTFLSEASSYLSTAPAYLVAKWRKELRKKGFSSVINPPDSGSSGFILLEDGGHILLEDGGNLNLEG